MIYEQAESGFYALYIQNDEGEYVQLTNAQLQNLTVTDATVLSAMPLASGDDAIKVVPLQGGMTELVYTDGENAYHLWGMANAPAPETFTFKVNEEETMESLDMFAVPESDTIYCGFYLYSSKGFTYEAANAVTTQIVSPSDASYDGFSMSVEPFCIDEENDLYCLAISTTFTEAAFADNGGVYTCQVQFLDADGGVMTTLPVNYTNLSFVLLTSRIQGVADQTVAQLTGGGCYSAGEAVEVTAPAVAGYTFVGWYAAADNEAGYDGDCVSTQMSYSFTMGEGDVSLVAVYKASGTAKLRVYGSDYLFNGVGPKKGETNKRIDAGSEIQLEYTGDGTFLYWKNGADKIVSTDKAYTFTLVTDTDLTMAIVDEGDMSADSVYCALVEFVSDYDQVMYADTWYSTDDAADFELPAGPSKPGYVFKGWEYDVQTILGMIDGSNPHITVHAVYEEYDAGYTYTVTNNVDDIVATHSVQQGDTLWVEAPARDGWTFSHMEDTAGNVISYSDSHAFWVSGDFTVKLVYVEATQTVVKAPTVAVTGSYAFEQAGKIKASFSITRDVPEGYTLVEHGMLVNRDGTLAAGEAELEMVIGSGKVIKATSTDKAALGTYVQNVNVTVEGATIFCRGYLIYKDDATGELTTIYTSVASVNP